MLEQFMKDCIPWGRPHNEAEEECEGEGASLIISLTRSKAVSYVP